MDDGFCRAWKVLGGRTKQNTDIYSFFYILYVVNVYVV